MTDEKICAGALLTIGDYYGSIAATRCLGEAGIPIVFADHRRLVPARWSRHVASRVQCPDTRNFSAFGEWLETFGKNHSGIFIYPTNDDVAFIMAMRQESLSKHFALFQPRVNAIMALLDKKLLAENARKSGLAAPETIVLSATTNLKSTIEGISLPVLVKPRTQVGLRTRGKGHLCRNVSEIVAAVDAFRKTEIYATETTDYDETLSWPMLQRYHETAVSGMLSISGFIPRGSQPSVMLAAEKVFQRPRRLGVGIAFEARELPVDLARRLEHLCHEVGYFGIFEAEFVTDASSGEKLLVDFNPRFYGQMAFEIARGLRLPLLAYYSAIGDEVALSKELQLARNAVAHPVASTSVYSLAWTLKLMIWTQSIGGHLSKAEKKVWKEWIENNDRTRFDAITGGRDPGPCLIEAMTHSWRLMRHPRDFYRKFFRDS